MESSTLCQASFAPDLTCQLPAGHAGEHRSPLAPYASEFWRTEIPQYNESGEHRCQCGCGCSASATREQARCAGCTKRHRGKR
jgi:hypothetical protein